MEERLQKLISNAGLASRRQAEEWILQGRVMVNGVTARELGAKADLSRDEVKVDGKVLRPGGTNIYIMLHKPEGYVTTREDPEGRPKVMDLIKGVKAQLHPVGRLDFHSSGLLLLTSDGDLTRFLTKPGSEVPKTYHVKVRERMPPEKIKLLQKGPDIGGPPLKPARVKFLQASKSGRHSWLEVVVTEGRNRQIRRMCQAAGHPVIKLKRTEVGPIKLGSLPPGEWRPLEQREVDLLKDLMSGTAPATPPKRTPAGGKTGGPARKKAPARKPPMKSAAKKESGNKSSSKNAGAAKPGGKDAPVKGRAGKDGPGKTSPRKGAMRGGESKSRRSAPGGSRDAGKGPGSKKTAAGKRAAGKPGAGRSSARKPGKPGGRRG